METKIKVRVKPGLGEVHVGTTGYSRAFPPGEDHEVTEQEYDLYLRHLDSLEAVGHAGEEDAED